MFFWDMRQKSFINYIFIILVSIIVAVSIIYLLFYDDSQTDSLRPNKGMILIPSGILNMGGDNEQANVNEFPKHEVSVSSFYMDETEVTNNDFSQFVKETNYITVAERGINWQELSKQLPPGTPKLSDDVLAPGALVFTSTSSPVQLHNPQQWWKWVLGASWKHPLGPESDIINLGNHPVVQISWEDANAFCKWAGKRLPTEVEWEWAARGGNRGKVYPWGNESINSGKIKANFYQGLFPYKNTLKDGYETTAPVKSYDPNDYGFFF